MWPNPQFPLDLVRFTEEILNRKLHFLGSEYQGSVTLMQILMPIKTFGNAWLLHRGLSVLSFIDFFNQRS